MEISRKEIAEKIRKEYASACEWDERKWRNYSLLMIDVSDGEIWADCFFENDWKVYHSDSIHRLDSMGGISDSEYVEGYIKDAIRQLEKAGWKIVE